MKNRLNRYQMCWSQADGGWMVVYARDHDAAQEKFENGEYVIEENE